MKREHKKFAAQLGVYVLGYLGGCSVWLAPVWVEILAKEDPIYMLPMLTMISLGSMLGLLQLIAYIDRN